MRPFVPFVCRATALWATDRASGHAEAAVAVYGLEKSQATVHTRHTLTCARLCSAVCMHRIKLTTTVTDNTCRLHTIPRCSCRHQSLVRILNCWCKTVELWPILRKSSASGSCRYIPHAQASVWLVKSIPGNGMDHIRQQAW